MHTDVAWDIDGTIYFNVLELDFFGYVARWGGRDKILPFNRINPQVRREDIRCILTFRPEWMRDMTMKELRAHGFDTSKVIVMMNPSDSDCSHGHALEFKAGMLNSMKCKYYVDNDDILRRNLQPMLWTTECISVEEFYILGLNNSGM